MVITKKCSYFKNRQTDPGSWFKDVQKESLSMTAETKFVLLVFPPHWVLPTKERFNTAIYNNSYLAALAYPFLA